MQCEKCLYKQIINIKDDHAFDTEFRRIETVQKDFCTHHGELCEEAHKGCEYRDITVEAQDIQHAINLLTAEAHGLECIESTDATVKKLKEILGE